METLVPYIKSISDQLLKRSAPGYKYSFQENFNYAVDLWLQKLDRLCTPSEVSSLRNHIDTSNLYTLWQQIYQSKDNSQFAMGSVFSPGKELINLASRFLSGTNIEIKIIVILAFISVSTSYMAYKLKEDQQKIEDQKRRDSSNSQDQSLQASSMIPQTSANIIAPKRYSLVLAIPASKEAILSSLYNAVINQKDYEELYKATQSLGVFETNQVQLRDQTNQFQVSEASEYDMYLVQVDLTQLDPRFGPDQDQMDRYDAFRNLPNLVADIKISSRLTMDVCTSFNLYVR